MMKKGKVGVVLLSGLGFILLLVFVVHKWSNANDTRDNFRCAFQPIRVIISYFQVTSQLGSE